MKVNDKKLINRWDNLMNDMCLEYLAINDTQSEVVNKKQYYGVEEGITVAWMLKEAKYWLSCYYESGHCRCDDRFEGENEYRTWVSETGRLKRLIAKLETLDKNLMIVEW